MGRHRVLFTLSGSIQERRPLPPNWGGIILTKGIPFNPYPAFPPNYMRTLHPGIRPTKIPYKIRDYSQASLKMASRWVKMASRWLQDDSRWPQDDSRWPQDGSRWLQDDS